MTTVDNPNKDSKEGDKDNLTTWTPPVGKEWLLEKFAKAENPETEQAKAYPEAEKRLRAVEAELNKLKAERPQDLREILAEKEDELAKVKAEVESLKRPPSTLSAEQQAFIKDWHSRLINEDPVVAARAVQEAIAGEINLYDSRRRLETAKERLEHQFEKAEAKYDKKEIAELMPYIEQIKKERPDLLKSEYGIEDILDKARIRKAEEEIAMEEETAEKDKEKAATQTTTPSSTVSAAEPTIEEMQKMSRKELKELIEKSGVKPIF